MTSQISGLSEAQGSAAEYSFDGAGDPAEDDRNDRRPVRAHSVFTGGIMKSTILTLAAGGFALSAFLGAAPALAVDDALIAELERAQNVAA